MLESAEKMFARIEKGHPLLGQYVIETTPMVALKTAKRLASSLNQMVYDREGVDWRFNYKKKGKGVKCYIVVRKLLVGDQEGFISDNLATEYMSTLN